MMEIKRVLFPTDFSDAAQSALNHALSITRQFDARLLLLHVRTPFSDDPAQPEFKEFSERDFETSIERLLDGVSEDLMPRDRAETSVIRNVSAAPAIIDFSEDQKVDLIVMGTHGRTGLSHFLLGSVAEKVVRHARCAVLTVARRKGPYRNNSHYQKILAAFDFSDFSKTAVRRGLHFAEQYKAHLEVLYVIEQTVHPYYDDFWKKSIEEEVPKIAGAAGKSVIEALGEENMKNLTLEVKIGDADGKAENEIVDHARSGEFDLVVMGTHGLSGLEHALMGSTTERVVRTAPCPVLTFHSR
jgi:nucleotide-binding universal stress UspA family protein